ALTEAVTGSSTAFEQAAINTSNYDTLLKTLASAVEALQITMGELLIKILTPLVAAFSSFILVLAEVPRFVRENKEEFIALGIAIISFNSATILASANTLRLAAAQRIAQIATVAQTIATQGLNAAMRANPIGFIIGAVSLLV